MAEVITKTEKDADGREVVRCYLDGKEITEVDGDIEVELEDGTWLPGSFHLNYELTSRSVTSPSLSDLFGLVVPVANGYAYLRGFAEDANFRWATGSGE